MHPETSSPTRDRNMTDSAASTIFSIVIVHNRADIPQHQPLIETEREPTSGSANLTLDLVCGGNHILDLTVDVGSSVSFAITLRASSGHLWVLRDAVAIYVISQILPSFVCVVVLSLVLWFAAHRCEYFAEDTGDGEEPQNQADSGTHTPPTTPIEPAVFDHSWNSPFGRFCVSPDGLTESEDVSDVDSRHGDEWEDIDL